VSTARRRRRQVPIEIDVAAEPAGDDKINRTLTDNLIAHLRTADIDVVATSHHTESEDLTVAWPAHPFS
jgi:hypothetical protein